MPRLWKTLEGCWPVMPIALSLALFATGCGGAATDGPERADVKGTVTLDGQPLNGATITFMPADNKGRVSGGTIENGNFSITGEFGATLGVQTVRINWQKPTGKKVKDEDSGNEFDVTEEAIPAKYNTQSQEKVTIKSGPNEYKLDVKTK